MTKEEVASIVKYCNDNGVSYKARLSELDVPEWKFFERKRRYAKEQVTSASPTATRRRLSNFDKVAAISDKIETNFN